MRQSWLRSLKRFILWDYPRGSRAYDVMVALILAFIFLTPRDFFRDQPKASSVVMLPGESGSSVFWIDTELLVSYPEEERPDRAAALIRAQSKGRRLSLLRLEPIFDSEEEIKGFMAIAAP